MMVLRQFIKLTSTELRLILREPEAVFFTFIFPVFMLFVIMEVFIPAEVPQEVIINHITPPLMVLIIITTALFGTPQSIVSYRKIKFLKRMRASSVAPSPSLVATYLQISLLPFLGLFYSLLWQFYTMVLPLLETSFLFSQALSSSS